MITCQAFYTLLIIAPVVNVFRLGLPILIFAPWNGILWFFIWPYEKELARVIRERQRAQKAEQQQRQSSNTA